MIQISIHKELMSTFKRTAIEMQIEFIEGHDSAGEQLVDMFLMCDGAEAFYLGCTLVQNRVDAIHKDVYRERKS